MDKCFLLFFNIILLGISGWSVAKDVTVYSGQLGDNLNIVCPYQQRADRWKKKIWCKEDEVGFCQSVVSLHPYWSFNKKINVSADIADNHHKGIITINITNLQKSDAGVYQCRTVTFGDVNTLKRIKVQVIEDLPDESESESADTQYSISGSQSATQTPVMLVAIGGSIILCKLLLIGLVYIWWKRHEDFYATKVDQEPFSLISSAGHTDAENSVYTAMEEISDGPQYINYVYLGHINQAP
ncbi:triggering receptor expressed on myeloid cells 2-like [Ranitomeya variabilis]|uniref:triggering receptor expressed on myeloid cells 2-like n=1 Tax=Ranitomeya variabilis TaxID=490064 RepID=UPI004056AD4B